VLLIQVLFYVSCALAVIAFLLFAALVFERFLTIRDLRKRIAQRPATAEELKGFDAILQAGPLEGADKLIEALANLTDSLAKAALPVVALIASLLFLIVALLAVYLGCKCCKKEPPTKLQESRLTIDIPHCIIGTFAEGKSQFQGGLLKDSPSGCLNDIRKRLRGESPPVLVIIGHVDLRELKPQSRRIYASNLSLAYQRALATRNRITESAGTGDPGSKAASLLSSHTVLLAVGANNVRETGAVAEDLLAADRVAEIISLWNKPLDSKP
jgi:hypothetical protein